MDLKQACSKYNKIIVWGLKNERGNTFRYIYEGFYQTLQKKGISTVWVDDTKESNWLVRPNDLIIVAGLAGNNLVFRDDVYYCTHNFDLTDKQYDPKKLLKLQVYMDFAELSDVKLEEVTFYDTRSQTLFQPWGTNLLESEFYPPQTDTFKLPIVFWVGSIWDNELHQGNLSEIAELKQCLLNHNIRFMPLSARVPEPIMIPSIQHSVISPAIAGKWQVFCNYLPCRMFKNISYGVLGVSNVPKFRDLFKGCNVEGDTIDELVSNALSLSKEEQRELIIAQQEIVKKHTYEHKLKWIMEALEYVRG